MGHYPRQYSKKDLKAISNKCLNKKEKVHNEIEKNGELK
ncbi:uncharacterized protein G2W53_008387 [Senna tora]|uniref:Uncharacterized protein n=1 Tax=Senna tora TaxID=362788 RepID=A0A834X8A8_9FABA|nr:uncharacterized protein G2W53_008387 [Senna tora]